MGKYYFWGGGFPLPSSVSGLVGFYETRAVLGWTILKLADPTRETLVLQINNNQEHNNLSSQKKKKKNYNISSNDFDT